MFRRPLPAAAIKRANKQHIIIKEPIKPLPHHNKPRKKGAEWNRPVD
jgi:hypothetical protein